MKGYVVCSAVCVCIWLTTVGVSAQGDNPCEADIARFCANLRPGGGAIADCLKQNEARLSPACKQQHLAEIGGAIRQTQDACREDSVKFCGGYLQQSGLPLLNCLKLNSSGLSPQCKEELFKALEQMHY